MKFQNLYRNHFENHDNYQYKKNYTKCNCINHILGSKKKSVTEQQ